VRSSLPILTVLLAVACGGVSHDPAAVATRYMQGIVAGDAGRAFAYLSTSDRMGVDSARFRDMAFDSDIGLDRLDTTVDSARVLTSAGDGAVVVVFTTGPDVEAVRRSAVPATDPPRRTFTDTLRLVREPEPQHWYSPAVALLRQPGVWRVSAGLVQRQRLERLAGPLRTAPEGTPIARLATYARAYMDAADQTPELAQPTDLDRARSALLAAAVADSLRFRLHVDDSAPGARYLAGLVENPTSTRVGILHLVITDQAGGQESIQVWGVAPAGSARVAQPTHLHAGPLRIAVNTLDVMGG